MSGDQDWATTVEVARGTHDLMLEAAFADPESEVEAWFVRMHRRHQCPLCTDAYLRDMKNDLRRVYD